MNHDKKILYGFGASFFGALLLTLLLGNELAQRTALAAIAALSCALSMLLIKKRSILKIEKWQVSWFFPVIGLIAVAFYYLLSVPFGVILQKNTAIGLLTVVLPMAIIIGCSEVTRRILLAQKNKWINISTYITFVVLDAMMLQQGQVLGNSDQLMDFVGMVLFPAITANILYTFVSARYGIVPVALYRLIMSCYAFVIPFKPAVPTALFAFLRMMLPLAVFLFLRILYERRRFTISKQNVYLQVATTSIAVILMSLWIMLISCKFHYGLLVIATESMTGSIDKGDAVIYEKYDGELIAEGQVIVFEKNGVVVIHRVIRIENVDDELRYYTKGDANSEEDLNYVTKNEIVGLTDVTIKYLGYPTLWMRDILKK